MLTGIRRKRQSSTLDDIDGFHCCTPPSNEIPKVVPECRNKVDQFGRNVAGADAGGVCPSTTIDCATKALSLSTVSDWRLVYRHSSVNYCGSNEVFVLKSYRQNSEIVINGQSLPVKAGINIAVFNQQTKKLEKTRVFDIYSSFDENLKLLDFIRSIESGRIVSLVVYSRKMSWSVSPSRHMKYKRLQKQLRQHTRLGSSRGFRYSLVSS